MTIDLASLSAEHFRPHLGETFYLMLPDAAPLALELKEVEENPRARMPRAPAERRMPFSLLFSGDPNAPLAGEVLPLRHPALGDLPPLLITRVMYGAGVLDSNGWFQICFN
jgi:hypothetical protein